MLFFPVVLMKNNYEQYKGSYHLMALEFCLPVVMILLKTKMINVVILFACKSVIDFPSSIKTDAQCVKAIARVLGELSIFY